MDNPYLEASTVDELRDMEKALYNETHENGRLLLGSDEYYEEQMLLFEEAFATLFPDDYDYHRRGRQAIG